MKAPKLPESARPWLWVVAAAMATLMLLAYSVVDIEPGEAAVRINNITSAETAITTPGWTTRIPLLHAIYKLDAAPQTFSMKGDDDQDDLHVRKLTVRASDGSNFHFEDTTIIFQLKGDEAVTAVRDAGPDNGYRRWLKPYVRSILRDEFGRESTIAVSDPTTYAQATNRAKDRLNEVLGPHGIVVTQLVTPRPQFNEAYEHAIEERNRLGNEQQVIRSNIDRAQTERERLIAEVDQAQNRIIQERRANLESDLARAVAELSEARRESDTYRIGKIAEGQAALSAASARAQQLALELDAKYLARKAEIDAFRSQPVERVMERLGQRLEGITIEIKPYADDATPSRVRYEDARAR
ncbi:MAG: SPFH domain-containing protein [Myxococcales bacterium]|nr:SPFH domain-containing protein [Myxococcales bacterium]